MSNAKTLVLAHLTAAADSLEPDAPALGSNARRANPLLISERSEYVQPIHRPDASTLANVRDGFYGRTDEQPGNTVSDVQLSAQVTRNAVGPRTRTSPASRSETGGQSF